MSFTTFDPYLEKELKSYSYDTLEDLEKKCSELRESQKSWGSLDVQERALRVAQMAEILEQNRERLARQASLEMGKPIRQSRAEVEKCAVALRQLSEMAPSILREQEVAAHYAHTQLRADPFGIVFSIQPWNFPYWQALRMAACAWMAGNVVLLKHSDLVAGCAELLEEVFSNETTMPILKNSRLSHEQAAQLMSTHWIQAVTFTGSTKGGRQVAQSAGLGLKKCVLELGGNDAYIVLADCDLDLTVKTCVKSRLINSGQSCIAAKRFFIEDLIFEEFKRRFLQEMAAAKAGSPLDEDTEVGPLASPKFLQNFENQVSAAKNLGARYEAVAVAEGPFSSRGVLDFDINLKGFENEELFGPVALLYKFKELKSVIKVLNEGPFGLGAGVFTRDLKIAKKCAREVHVGTFTINSFVQSDPRVPFGGTRDSGFGREMGGQGLNDFVSWKVIGQA